MTTRKIADIDAIAFDIDGTLYPAWKLTLRIIPFFICNARFLNAFRKTRRILPPHSISDPDKVLPNFFELQSELLAAYLNITFDEAQSFLENKIYQGWKKTFLHIKPYPFAREAIERLKAAGFKIGILSDFPPEQKGNVWDILPFCDAAINSEAEGALKPSHIPFRRLAQALGTSCDRILYVGNSKPYDVAGAAAVGMKTAYIANPVVSAWLSVLGKSEPHADISFSNYRQFLNYVL